MTLFAGIFYLISAVMVFATAMAITRRQVIHGVVYLIISFVSTGLLFYLLGAPFLAALEVIIYAGAIMVLFLFVVMTVKIDSSHEGEKELSQWLPALILSLISLFVSGVLIFEVPGSREGLKAGMATPSAFGHYLFKTYWFPVEIASFLLLIGLVGALYLGKQDPKEKGKGSEARS